MEKKKFNFKKLGIVLCVCFITLFAFIPFVNSSSIDNVYASSITPSYSVDNNSCDSVTTSYSFKSSDLYNVDAYFSMNSVSAFHSCLFSSDILYTNDTLTITPHFSYLSVGTSLSYYDCVIINGGVSSTEYVVNRGVAEPLYFNRGASDFNNGSYFFVELYSSENFNANVYKVVLELKTTAYIQPLTNVKYLHITYYDRNDETLSFVFLVPTNYIFNTRTYFLTNDFTGDEMFDQGYQNGYQAGLDDGKTGGYNDGYTAGQVVGFEDGYNTGINDSNQYSFYNLFGAVLDAPVKVFSCLFNFNLMGVNLLGLITGLFTLAMIILVIKLIIGGK